MSLPKVPATTTTHQVRGLALFRLIITRLLILGGVVGLLGFILAPTLLNPVDPVFSPYFLLAAFWFVIFGLWLGLLEAWKVEVSNDGVVFYTLFRRRFVSWANMRDLQRKPWGNGAIYVVHLRDGVIRFLSGMNSEEELISTFRQYIPERLLNIEKACYQSKGTLFMQGWELIMSAGITVMFIFGIVVAFKRPDVYPPNILIILMISTVIIVFLQVATTALRAKRVEITERGIRVKTWISEIEVNWRDILVARQFRFLKGMALRTSKSGWLILGEELSRFDELSKLILNNARLINTHRQKDKHLPG